MGWKPLWDDHLAREGSEGLSLCWRWQFPAGRGAELPPVISCTPALSPSVCLWESTEPCVLPGLRLESPPERGLGWL